ncbi:hypothetical protein B0H14DRAFT_2608307 [Mycena olivaceomarginata]|nr:hypothetical protein B0H14DRAFT_2608307 [Mycena olivaceomarginata]
MKKGWLYIYVSSSFKTKTLLDPRRLYVNVLSWGPKKAVSQAPSLKRPTCKWDVRRDTGIKSGHSSGPTARLVKEGLIVPVCPPRRTHRMSICQRQVDAKGSTAPRCPPSPAEVDNMHASSRVHADRMGRFLAVCIRSLSLGFIPQLFTLTCPTEVAR